MSRKYVIGDIHGCHRTMMALLNKINPDPDTDFLIFLGDYINRGPDSSLVISELIKLKKRYAQNCITLMGNHEQMFLNFLAGNDEEFFLMMGGDKTLKSYGISSKSGGEALNKLPDDHIHFLRENLLTHWEDENYIYVHAGVKPGVHLSQQSTSWLLWAREKFIRSNHDFDKKVIFGHTPYDTPRFEENKIAIDTGAVYGGKLTCLILPEKDFISIPLLI